MIPVAKQFLSQFADFSTLFKKILQISNVIQNFMLGKDLGTLSSKAVSSIDFLSNLSFIPFVRLGLS